MTEKSDKALNKIIKALGEGVREDMDAMPELSLRSTIFDAEVRVREIELEQEQDEKLVAAKLVVSDLQGSYRDAKKAQQAKIKYGLHRLEQQGKI